MTVRLGDVKPAVAEVVVEAVGSLVAEHDVTVSAKVPGRLSRVAVDVGDRVAPGAVLAVVDETDFRLALMQREFALQQVLAELGTDRVPGEDFDLGTVPSVARARAEAENAQRRLERVRALFERPSPLVAEQEYRDRLTELEVAQRNVASAEHAARALVATARARAAERDAAAQRLADCTIGAPVPVDAPPSALPGAPLSALPAGATGSADGPPTWAVAERFVSAGEYVREGDRLVRLVWDTTLRFRAAVPERFVGQVEAGQVVHLRADGVSGAVQCTVRRVAPAIDPATRTFQLEAEVPNASLRLKPGGFARGQVVVGRRDDVREVPAASLVSFAGIDRVFSVADGRAAEHVVEVVDRRGDRLVVSGLPGSVRQVVVSNAGRLARGVAVQVEP
ncbi:MAG: efflux RND transporter periplasmic adaptor subunit [Tepidisphaerales bacterium]